MIADALFDKAKSVGLHIHGMQLTLDEAEAILRFLLADVLSQKTGCIANHEQFKESCIALLHAYQLCCDEPTGTEGGANIH